MIDYKFSDSIVGPNKRRTKGNPNVEQAIASRKLVEFMYCGHIRFVEPHSLGIRNGTIQLLGYQVGGSNSSGIIPEWQLFDLIKISGLKIRRESFSEERSYPSDMYCSWDYEIAAI